MLKSKRLFSLCMALMLCMSLFTFVMPAQAATISDVGLSLSSSASAAIKKQVFVQSEELWVFNISNHNPVSSNSLIAALASSGGYTLSYCDADKNAATTDLVKDGYVKAVKDSDEVYIPVISRVDETGHSSDFNSSTSGMISTNTGYSYTGSIGGKDADDLSLAYDFTKVPGQTVKEIKRDGNSTYSVLFNTTYTVETSFFHNGEFDLKVKPWVGVEYELFTMKSDGTAAALNWNVNANVQKDIGTVSKGKWHRIAITFDIEWNRFLTYLDGELVGNAAPNLTLSAPAALSAFTLGTYQSTNESGTAVAMTGVAAWDDLKVYRGYYDDKGNSLNQELVSNVKIDSEAQVLYYNGGALTTVKAVKEAVLAETDATGVKIFKDAALAAEVTEVSEITEDSVAVIVSKNGLVYYYYSISGDNWKEKVTILRESFNGSVANNTAPDKTTLQIYSDSNAYQTYTEGEIAGKDTNDKSFVIKGESATGILNVLNQPHLKLSDEAEKPYTVITTAASVYIDKECTLPAHVRTTVIRDSGDTLNIEISFEADGYVYSEGYGEYRNLGAYNRGEWNRVAMMFDTVNNKAYFYLNGEMKREATLAAKTITGSRLWIEYGSSVTEAFSGLHAFDDYEIYGDSYSEAVDKASISSQDAAVSIENSSIVIKGLTALTPAEIKSKLTSSGDVRIYTDSTLKTLVADTEKVGNNAVAVVESASGKSYAYYTMYNTPEISFSLTGTTLTLTAELPQGAEKAAKLIIGEYSTGGKLEKAYITPITAASLSGCVEVTYNSAYTYRGFMFTDNELIPVTDAASYPIN